MKQLGKALDIQKIACFLNKQDISVKDLLLIKDIDPFVVNVTNIDIKGFSYDWPKLVAYNTKYLMVLMVEDTILPIEAYKYIGKRIKLHVNNDKVVAWSVSSTARHVQIKIGKDVKYIRKDFIEAKRHLWFGRKERID